MGELLFLAGALLSSPLLAAIHELGHALAALSITNDPVILQIGRGDPVRQRTGRRLTLALGRHPWTGEGQCRWQHPHPSRREVIVFAAGGPVASLLFAIPLVALASHTPGGASPAHPLVWGAAGAAMFAVVITAIPMRYPLIRAAGPGSPPEAPPSDGLVILSLLRRRPAVRAHAPADTPLVRKPYLAILVALTILAFIASPTLGLATIVIFGLAAYAEGAFTVKRSSAKRRSSGDHPS
jgi:hypothetical protein